MWYIIITEGDKQSPKEKEIKAMMYDYCVTTTKQWYDSIKDKVTCVDPYFFNEEPFGEMVEYNVNKEEFERVSTELGWM
jgi:hypothetical protein